MVNVVGHVRQRGGMRRGMRLSPRRKPLLDLCLVVREQFLQSFLFLVPQGGIGALGFSDVTGHKANHHHPAIGSREFQHVIRHVAGVMAQSAGGGVGKDDRRFTDPQGGTHGFIRYVRKIHQHPQTVHLVHDLLTERSQAVMLRFVRG